MSERPDPMEETIAGALDAAGIAYTREKHGSCPGHCGQSLDFHLTASDTYIEVKRFHSPRIADQMARHENVIAIQGMDAARLFAELIAPDTRREEG